MPQYVYVSQAEGRKLLGFSLDSGSGELRLCTQVEFATQPWQFCADPSSRFVYQTLRGDARSAAASFVVDPVGGSLQQTGEVELEANAVYVTTDRTGRFLLTSYLVEGFAAVHAIGEKGTIRAGSVARRQTEIYAHAVVADPSNRYAYVPHVSPTDSIHPIRFDEKSGSLTPCEVRRIATAPGAGPRHMAFHPSLDVVYANEAQVSSVGVYAFDPETGSLERKQSLPTLPDKYAGENSTGSLRVHPSGKAVYVSNRGHNSIATFAVDKKTGLLSPLGESVSTGPIPRAVAITPDGRHFFAGSDHTGRFTAYRIDDTGDLERLATYDVGNWVTWILPLSFD